MSRLRILTLFAALIAVASLFAACGGGGGSDDPQSVVDEATLEGIESGDLDLSLAIDAKGPKGGHVDVTLSGPFASESEEELPELDLSATAKGGIGDEKVDFDGGLTLLGNKAFVAYEGVEYEVDPTTLDFVKTIVKQQGAGGRQPSESEACQEAAADLKLGDFVEGPSDGGSADVGGTETTKVRGDLNAEGAIEATQELIDNPACSKQLRDAGPLPSTAELEKARTTVRDSLKSARVELYVGDDHIVRRISAQVTIEPSGGSGDGPKRVDLDLDLTLTGVNEEQAISAPESAKPLSNLFLKLGINPIELLGMLQGQGGGIGSGGLDELLEGIGSVGSAQ